MIAAPLPGHWLIVTQTDHAHFAGELLALWRADGLPEHPRREDLLRAAREHDNGWAEIDSAPMCDPSNGHPIDFITIPREIRWQIWRLGTRRHVERHPYTALLIVRHAIQLHRSQIDDPDWVGLFTEWQQLEAELIESIGVKDQDVTRDYRWIELTDHLSLAVCNQWCRTLEQDAMIAEFSTSSRAGTSDSTLDDGKTLDGGTLMLDPFPLAGATTFKIACRVIPDRRYSGDTDLATELAMARWRQAIVRVMPRDP